MSALAIVAAVLLSASPKPAYVKADILRVRASPNANAATLGRLRINTEVQVLEKKKGWVRLRVATNPPLEGWGSEALLSVRRLRPADLRTELAAAAGPEAKLALLERLAAIEPTDLAVQNELLTALREAGKTEAADLVEKRLAGELRAYVATCMKVGERKLVVVAASFTATAGFEPLAGRPEAPLATIASGLGGLTWLKLKEGHSVDLAGSPFPSPAVEAGVLDSDFIRLGGCTDAELGWVYVSGPINRWNPNIEEEKRIAALQAPVSEVGVSWSRFAWARQVYGPKTMIGIAPFENSGSGLALLTVPATPAAVRLDTVRLVGPPPAGSIYFAAAIESQKVVLARASPEGRLAEVSATFDRDEPPCPAEEVDLSKFPNLDQTAWEAFVAGVGVLEDLAKAELTWFRVGGGSPRRAKADELHAPEISCVDFPSLRKSLVIGQRETSKKHVAYASRALKAVPAPELAADLKRQVANARADQTWLETHDGAVRFGILPFDEVTCEAQGDDSICGGDMGFYVVSVPQAGTPQVLRVVTSTTGC